MAVAATMSAAQRRVLFGVNVLVSAALALAILVAAVWISKRFSREVDLTAEAVNSLSPRTTKLLSGLPTDVRITAFYSVLSKYDEKAIKWRDTVRDMLVLYDRAGGSRVNTRMVEPMEELAPLEELAARLRDKPTFRDEAAPHAAVLEKLTPLLERVQQLGEAELAALQRFAEADQRLFRVRELTNIALGLKVAAEDAASLQRGLKKLLESALPRVGQALEEVRPTLPRLRTALQESLDWMAGDARKDPDLKPEAREFFNTCNERYAGVLADLTAIIAESQNLKRVKLEEFDALLRDCKTSPIVVIETPESARILSLDDVWPRRTDAAQPRTPGDTREFNGEAAISSAILQLTQTEKTAVVFTRFGGVAPFQMDPAAMMNPMQRSATPPFEQLGRALEAANFIPLDWDLATLKEAPQAPDASRYIYVIFPPSVPPQADPQQPPPRIGPAETKAITDAVEKAAAAVFLADGMGFQFDQRANMYLPDFSRMSYEFGDYLRSNWGVDVRQTFVTTVFQSSPGGRGKWVPVAAPPACFAVATPPLRFGPHEITSPLGSLPALLFQAAPLAVTGPATQPASDDSQRVKVETLVEVGPTEDVWAVKDFMHIVNDVRSGPNGGTAPLPDDITAPFPVLVAVTKGPARLVVSGSSTFIYDEISQASQLVLTSRGAMRQYLGPANTDLFLNALHWLAGNADRIAVGPRKSDVPRLDRLTEGPVATFWRWFFVGLWPGLVLLAGVGVWLVRRR